MATVEANLQKNARIPGNISPKSNGHHNGQSVSIDVRLAQKWGCQLSTAKARRERALRDALDTIETCLALGDTDRLAHYLSLFDAAITVQPGLHHIDAIHAADRTDAVEDVRECEYRENPCKETARAWFDALGKESRQNEPAMAALRQQWDL